MVERETSFKTLGEVFRYQIAMSRLNAKEVAEEIGISPSTISRIINGKVFWPRCIIPIARWCRLTPQELWILLEAETHADA